MLKQDMKGTLNILLLTLILLSCTVNFSRKNRPEDIANAKTIGAKFYDQMKITDYPKTYNLYADTFFNKVDTSVLLNYYRIYHDKIGDIKSYTVANCDVICTNGLCSYKVVYDVEREKGMTKEILIMKSNQTEMPKLIRYMVLERAK